jgi:hypothetical protein
MPILEKFKLTQQLTVNNSYTKFQQNLTNHSVADTKLQTDRHLCITLLKFIQNVGKLLVSRQLILQEQNATHKKEERLEDQEVDGKSHLQIFQP